MSYVRQNKDNDSCSTDCGGKSKAAAGQFNDQRDSALVQLQQQRLMAAAPLQRMAMGDEEDELLQGKFVAQRQGLEDEEDILQGKFEPAQRAEKPNNTGLPDNLKSGIENLSGMSMDHVKVHYNSDKPAQLQAHAYAQGSEIHVAPGQEQHLPHEVWHVVQQMQGRVRPTVQMQGGVEVNDDEGLEGEADLMGEKALSVVAQAVSAGGNVQQHMVQAPPLQLEKITPKGVKGITHLVKMTEEGSLFNEDLFLENECHEVEYGNVVLVDEDNAILSRRGIHQDENWQRDQTAEPTNLWLQAVQVDEEALMDDDIFVRDEMLLTPEEDSPEMLRRYADIMLNNQGVGLHRAAHERVIDFLLFVCSIANLSLSQLKLTNSSGSSLVVLPQGKPYIVQHFFAVEPYEKIRSKYIEKLPEVGGTFEVWISSDTLQEEEVVNAEIFDHITRATHFLDDHQAIRYERIQPLNTLFEGDGKKESLEQFIQANAKKIAWDITFAIYGLAQGGLTQGDVRLDNVGIKGGKFVLFDYDGFADAGYSTEQRDLDTLNTSLLSYGAEAFTLVEIAKSVPGDTLAEKIVYIQNVHIAY